MSKDYRQDAVDYYDKFVGSSPADVEFYRSFVTKTTRVLDIAMRVLYPAELINLVESHGFVVTKRFGGYEGERWGEGSELVVVFKHANDTQCAPLNKPRHD